MLSTKIVSLAMSITLAVSTQFINITDAALQGIKAITDNVVEVQQEEVKEVTIVVAGDNLIHSRVIQSGKTSDGYDYTAMYAPIKEVIESHDLAIINQETVLINDASRYSGYPCFGSPTAIGDAVIDAGFDIVLHSTNHVWDKGVDGVLDSIHFWQEHDMPYVGVRENEEDPRVIIVEENGIKIALCNYTYSTNGIVIPNDLKYMVNMLYDKDAMLADLQYAEENADITIVFPHWGVEYNHGVTEDQRQMAQFMADNGADIIVGTHPHVIEPVERITNADGKEVLVYWSLGNFISNQDEVPRMLGLLAEIIIRQDESGTYFVQTMDTPIVTHIESYSNYFEVYPLWDYTEELAEQHRLRRVRGEAMSLHNLNKIFNEVIWRENIQ